MEAEIEVTWPQVRECQWPLEAEDKEQQSSLESLEKGQHIETLISDFRPL